MTVPGELFVGCPMWANRAWVGPYFPPSTKPGDELAEYAQWCTAVEGNTTFYALPPTSTVHRWAEMTPASFRFVFKLPSAITHQRRLRDVGPEVMSFRRLLEPLGERIGPVSIQLPPSFGPGDLGLLAAFLRRAPRDVRWAIEVRHADFFDGGRAETALNRLITDSGAERIVFDTATLFAAPPTDDAERDGWANKPRHSVVPDAFTDTPIVRYIGRTDEAATVAGWQRWLPVLAAWVDEGRRPIVFVHTPDNSTSVELARRLHDDVRALSPALRPLPEPPDRPDEPVQGSLFG